LLVWSAGAGASTLSPTPFGLGFVEPAMIAALAAAGISSPDAVGAILLYRITTFKIAGMVWVVCLHLQHRRVMRRLTPAETVDQTGPYEAERT
jgi:uncharacterized membrane protein YbhN (UPF0104 family)